LNVACELLQRHAVIRLQLILEPGEEIFRKDRDLLLVREPKLDFADFARVLDAGPEDCRFRNNARGLFDAGCHASEGAERNPSFLRQ
jgi:hypothetical protein